MTPDHRSIAQALSPSKWTRTLLYHVGLYRGVGARYAGLHLGSGEERIDSFCNIDANPLGRSDVVAGVERIKFGTDTVESIYNSHVFEHIPRAKALATLGEWCRVLKPGGKLYVCVPDVEALFRLYLERLPDHDSDDGRWTLETLNGIIYGGQTNKYDFHFAGYSLTTLRAMLEQVGFRDVRRFDRAELRFDAPRDASFAAVHDVPVSLNVVATK